MGRIDDGVGGLAGGSGDDGVKLHRRQFLLAPKAFAVAPDWICEPFGPTHVLSHCPDLIVTKTRDADGVPWVLLGRAVPIDARLPDPKTAIERASTDTVPDLSYDWAGRWLLLTPAHAYPDASALFGCVYCTDHQGAVWLSSSPTLLAGAALPKEPDLIDPRVLVYEHGISWFPPPLTRYGGIRRLLPSQVLRIGDGGIRPRPMMLPIEPIDDVAAATQWLAAALTDTMTRVRQATGLPLWLGLTAGFDSRLMLAIAKSADLDVRTFTRLTARMTIADRVLPPRLARMAGYPHRAMSDTGRHDDRNRMLRHHAPGQISRGDAEPFLRGVRDAMTGISIGGHGFAIASGFSNWRSMPESMPDPAEATAMFLKWRGEPPDSPAALGLEEWFRWVQQTPQARLDWRDRLFLEQRQAGWLAAKEQVHDMDCLERFPILNAASLYARILGIDARSRLGSRLQRDLIETLRPEFLDLPFNPRDRAFLARSPHRVLFRRLYFLSRSLNRRLTQPRSM